MNFALFDMVALTQDLPAEGLHAGMPGCVVDIYTQPEEGYEVEFCDPEGNTLAILALRSHQMKLVTSNP